MGRGREGKEMWGRRLKGRGEDDGKEKREWERRGEEDGKGKGDKLRGVGGGDDGRGWVDKERG